MRGYGKELIIDLKGCDASLFTRSHIEEYFKQICHFIDMKRQDLHFWDYGEDLEAKAKAPDHLCGISAVQFIETSNITIHALDRLGEVYINIFSCKEFDEGFSAKFTADFFKADKYYIKIIERGEMR